MTHEETLEEQGPECEDCHERSEDVCTRPCPYTEDVHNRTELVTICDRCAQDRCMEI